MRRPRGRWRTLAALVGAGSLAAAVLTELRTPPGRRTWRGTLLGVVPYDLRPPTPARLRQAYWNPDEPRLVVPRVFGVGWALNLYQLWRRVPGARP
jgi:Family of unknown function (DUF5808)